MATLVNLVFTVISVIYLAVWVCQLIVNPLLLGVNKNGHHNEIYTKGIEYMQIFCFSLSTACLLLSRVSDGNGLYSRRPIFSHPRSVSHASYPSLLFHKQQSTYHLPLQHTEGIKDSLSLPSLTLSYSYFYTHALALGCSKFTLAIAKLTIL